MKVALILTGLLRCFEQAYPSFKQFVIDRYETDVYLDIWSEVGYYSGKGYIQSDGPFIKTAVGERGFHTSGELVNASRIMELYKPTSLRIEDYSLFEPAFEKMARQYPNALTRPKNTLAQAFKIKSALEQLIPYSEYELIVRARPDIVLEHDPGMWRVDEFVTLPSRNSRGTGTGDSIQVGSYWDIQKYSKMYDHIPALYHDLGYSCPHAYAEAWIRKNGFNWREMAVGAHVAHSPRGAYQEPE